ncbi:MAG: acyl carrier protein [Oscillibacter sp.]|nr:acyl carrier protein [Oscillibacter sp.]
MRDTIWSEPEIRPLPCFAQRLYENGYFRQEELKFADCDRNKRLRMASLLSILAAFGGYDYDARGLTHEKLSELRTVFLLSRAAVRLFRTPVYREVLDIRTWEDGPRGPHFHRVFELRDAAGALCAAAKTDWILVDPVSRKILRPASFTARTPGTCPVDIDCPDPKKIRLPREGGEAWGTRRVAWSDLDGNGHLYSGNYGDIVWDALPADLRERPVAEFQINYHKEAALDEELRLSGWRTENGFLMEGQGRTGACFAAECVFAPDVDAPDHAAL